MNDKIMIPLVRRLMPAIIANEIVGVQTMTDADYFKSWRDHLDFLQAKYTSWLLTQECSGDGIKDATEIMQEFYPGPYRIIEEFDPNRGMFRLNVKFDDPHQEMLWKIKWS